MQRALGVASAGALGAIGYVGYVYRPRASRDLAYHERHVCVWGEAGGLGGAGRGWEGARGSGGAQPDDLGAEPQTGVAKALYAAGRAVVIGVSSWCRRGARGRARGGLEGGRRGGGRAQAR